MDYLYDLADDPYPIRFTSFDQFQRNQTRNVRRRLEPALEPVAGPSRVNTEMDDERRAMNGRGSTYVMRRKKFKNGKKLPITQYIDRVVKPNIVHVRERFGAITDPSDTVGNNRGAYWLNHGTVSTPGPLITIDGATYGSYLAYPIHVWPICNTSANPTYPAGVAFNVGNGGYELIGGNIAALPNKIGWKRIGGWSNSTVVTVGTYFNGPAGAIAPNIVAPEVIDNEQTTNTVLLGRSALLEWFKIKTLVYAKKTRPTMIRFSIVSFMDERISPDWWWFLGPTGNATTTSHLEAKTFDGVADEFWRSRLRPLIANPCSENTVVDKGPKMKVHGTKIVTLNSKESTESDADPEQQFIDWFNRVNKQVEFGTFSTGAVVPLQTDATLENPNYVQAPAQLIGQCPVSDITKNLYLLVESYQPDRENWIYQPNNAAATNPTNALSASYDFMLRKSWAVVE